MTNDQIDDDMAKLAAAVAAGMTPGLPKKASDAALVEALGAAFGLIGGFLKNINDIAANARDDMKSRNALLDEPRDN